MTGVTFAAPLADPTQRRLLGALAEEGEASATRLADRLPVSRQSVVGRASERAGGRRAGHRGAGRA